MAWTAILKLASGLVSLLGLLASLFGRKRDREAGANEERAKQSAKVITAASKANDASMSVDALSDSELNGKLDKYFRD